MNQARNDDGSYDNGWSPEDQGLPPSLGVWPVGRTYVHSSDGALNTGPASAAAPSADSHGAPSANGHGGRSPNGRGGPDSNGRGAPGPAANGSARNRDGRTGPRPVPGGQAPPPSGRPALYEVGGGSRGDDWPPDQSFGGADHIGADHISVPPFTGAAVNGAAPRYDAWASAAPAPTDQAPPSRPPLYQVGGRYRSDDWPTDPGFRRGDLGLDPYDVSDLDPRSDPDLSDLGRLDSGDARPRHDPRAVGPDPTYREPHHDPSFGGPDPTYREPGHDPGSGGPDPGYREPRYGDGHARPETAYADRRSYGDPGAFSRPDDDADSGRGAADRWREPGRPATAPAQPYDRGAGRAPRPERGDRQRPDPAPVRPIRPGADAERQAAGGHSRETWARNVTPAARVAAVEDAKLLAFLHELIQRLKSIPSLYPRLVFLVVGYAAITSLAAAYAEKLPLPITASLIVIPAAGIIFNMGMRYPDWGRRALVGWLAGIVATIIYDVLRLALVKVGIWGDPIPGIGRLVFADPHANFAWGYLWRFMGNGGGMGIAYTMLPWRGVRTGVAYGTLICSGLVALLFFFPVAQVHFFPLTPVTTAGAYAGHWVYGAVLGKITSWWLPPVELGRIHGRLTARLLHPGHRPRHVRGAAGSTAGDARRAADRRSA